VLLTCLLLRTGQRQPARVRSMRHLDRPRHRTPRYWQHM